MLDELREEVCRANLRLVAEGLVFMTWGNVSGIDRAGGRVVIKPSGVPYEGMAPEHMVVVSLEDGRVVDGGLRPSSDTPTHLELYRALSSIGGIVHTHSLHATCWAQARRAIPALGTTHADFCHGPVPITRPLRDEEIRQDYEANTGRVIVETLAGAEAAHVPAILVAEHGPFAWGRSSDDAVTHAAVLEKIAEMAALTVRLQPHEQPISPTLLDKHFLRKHGPGAYYGQGR
ncbi:MAG: L-ribulose-5-phosphate 4-epimerase AraD [Planctomycetes bacterium]|nr:L-ribulose-5-phosphate 4-epimerase AraD [Planctomycetota bacterium]